MPTTIDLVEKMSELEEAGKDLAFSIIKGCNGDLTNAITVAGTATEIIMAILLRAAETVDPSVNKQELKENFLMEVSENIDKEMEKVKECHNVGSIQ